MSGKSKIITIMLAALMVLTGCGKTRSYEAELVYHEEDGVVIVDKRPKEAINEDSREGVKADTKEVAQSGTEEEDEGDVPYHPQYDWEVPSETSEKASTETTAPEIQSEESSTTVEEPKQSTAPAKVEEYDNSNVRTTLNAVRYTAKGSKVYCGNELIVDLSKVTSTKPKYTQQMAQTYFISDLASEEVQGGTVLYIIGLAFQPRAVNLDNTAEYHQQMVNVGMPHVIVFKHVVKENKTYTMLSQSNFGIWTTKIFNTKNEFDESKVHLPDDSLYKGDEVYIDFLANSILPHMILHPGTGDLFAITGVNSEDISYQEHTNISIMRLSTDSNKPNPVKQVYFLIQNFELPFESYGYHHVDTHGFYLANQDDGTIAMASIGHPDSEIATAYSLDPHKVDTIQHYWRDRDEVMRLVEN